MYPFADIDVSLKRLPPVYGYRAQKLTSLEKALEPVQSQIDQLPYFVKIAKRNCHYPSEHGLSHDESASIYIYTMEWGETSLYRVLNKALRSDNRQTLTIWFPYLKLFDTASDKLPTVKQTVWRGVNGDIGKNCFKGQVLQWWFVSSCSLSLDVTRGFLEKKESSTLFRIEAINGKKTSGYAQYESEDEIILRIGTELHVKSDPSIQPNGSFLVHLVEVDDENRQPLASTIKESNLNHKKEQNNNANLNRTSDENGHVMLSYNHNSKDLVKSIYESLRAENIPVWFDERDMQDNMYDSMAKAVSDASVVCCFLTREYEESKNCKLELEYAQKLRKRIIPCMVSNRKIWKPTASKWLDFITGSTLAIDFSDTSAQRKIEKIKELIHRIKHEPSTATNEPRSSSHDFRTWIKQKYLQESTVIRMMDEGQCFPIEQSYVNLAIVGAAEQQEKEKLLKEHDQKDRDKYSDPMTSSKRYHGTLLSTYEEIHTAKTPIDVQNIFNECKGSTRKILILGRAGIGKSIFCQYVTYRWAKDELLSEYQLVVLIRLRKLTENRYPPGTYSLADLLKKEYFPFEDLSYEEIQSFTGMCNKHQVLWILDGYDEFSKSSPEQLRDVFECIYRTQHHILTSRPYAIELRYDVKLEIVGFTNDDIPKYIDQFFNQLKPNIQNVTVESKKLLRFLESNSNIWGISHIPVNLELICSLWTDPHWSKTTALTMTTLYDNIIEWLCRRHLARNKINHGEMSKQAVYKHFDGELQLLELLAFRAMEYNTILFTSNFLEEIEAELVCPLSDYSNLFNIGILKSYEDNSIGTAKPMKKQHYFIHLSFQEHFAARYLLRLLKGTTKQNAINFIKNNRYDHRFHFVFTFGSGLLAHIPYRSCLELFWSTIQEEPADLIGITAIKLTIACIDELLPHDVFPQRTQHLKSISDWIKFCSQHHSPPIREQLVQSLNLTNYLLKNSLIQNTLVTIIEQDQLDDPENIIWFVSALCITEPSEKLIFKVLPYLKHPKQSVRVAACHVLESIGEKAATPEVIAALINVTLDEQDNVRAAAYQAFGSMGDRGATSEVISTMLNGIGDKGDNAGSAACTALGSMGAKAATSAVIDAQLNAIRNGAGYLFRAVADAWVNMWEKAYTGEVIAAVLKAVRDPNENVRAVAWRVFGRLGERGATPEVIATMLEALRDGDSYDRQAACQALHGIGEKAATPEVIAALIHTIDDKDENVRRAACATLGNIGTKAATPEVIAVLVHAMQDACTWVRNVACESVGRIEENAVTDQTITAVVDAMGDTDESVRRTAHEILAQMSENGVMSKVITVLVHMIDDKDENVRTKACITLGNMGDKAATPEVIDTMLKAMGDENMAVVTAACIAMGNMGAKAATPVVIKAQLSAIRNGDEDIFTAATDALVNMCEKESTKDVIAAMLNAFGHSAEVVREGARRVLMKIWKEAVSSEVIVGLVHAMEDEDEDVRTSAYLTLGNMGENAATPEVIATMLKAMGDVDWFKRKAACEALGSIGENVATPEVIAALVYAMGDDEESVCISACSTLGSMGEKAATSEVIATMLREMRDGGWFKRKAVCEALASIGEKVVTPEVIAALIHTMEDKDESIRRTACGTLGNMGTKVATPEVIAALIHVMEDEDENVRTSAYSTLGNMGEKAATPEVIATMLKAMGDGDGFNRKAACEALGSIGEKAATPEVVAALIHAMEDKDNSIRTSAYLTLGNIGERAATPEVIAALVHAIGDEDDIVRTIACISLGRMGAKAATPAIIEAQLSAISNGSMGIVRAATQVLVNMCENGSTEDVIAAVLNALRDPDQLVRAGARGVLFKVGWKAATPEVIAAMLETMQDGDLYDRGAACEALGRIGEKAVTPEVIAAMLHCIRDDDDGLLFAARQGLVEISKTGAKLNVIGAILETMRDEDWWYCKKLFKVLEEMVEEAATPDVIAMLLDWVPDDLFSASEVRRKYLKEMLYGCTRKFHIGADLIEKIHSFIAHDAYFDSDVISIEHLLSVYIHSGDSAWLPLIFTLGLLNGMALTVVHGGIKIHKGGEAQDIDVTDRSLIDRLMEVFKVEKIKMMNQLVVYDG
ncbi:unnamed protein product [Rotaria socialis]|uniref:NACHT domain-containing protein n=2 Tax=Rotaria socialis TaxID=392032 RepID=A0A820YA27_9BILA|nr:unnamed protein product [Rotaria socialis]